MATTSSADSIREPGDVDGAREIQGAIARIRDGDIVRLDAVNGLVDVLVDAAEFAARVPATADLSAHQFGLGRELFGMFRRNATTADLGAGVF